MKNENELKFSFLIFKILRKMNWHSGTRIDYTTITLSRKWYQFANWAEPSIKQVSRVANRKDKNTIAVSFVFLFLCEPCSKH